MHDLTPVPREPQYQNAVSRLLLTQQWENQHIVALDPPRARLAFMRLLARTLLKPHIETLRVKAPIFILGTPRCGSTMLQELLCQHEKIAYVTHTMDVFGDPQVYYAADWLRRHLPLNVRGERYLKDSIIVDGASPSEAMRFWGQFLGMDPHALVWPQRSARDFSAEQRRSIDEYLRYVIAAWRWRGGERFLNKSPALFTEARLLQELFPDARFIYLIRDGRQVANSLIKLYQRQSEQDIKVQHPLFKDKHFIPYPRLPGLPEWIAQWGAADLRTTAHVWDASVKYMNEIRGSLTHLHDVRYEDILANPREEMAKLLDFCELHAPETGRQAFEEKLAGVGRVGHRNTYGGYELIESIAGDSLRQHGYL